MSHLFHDSSCDCPACIYHRILSLLHRILSAKRAAFRFGVSRPISKLEFRMPLDLSCTNEEKIRVTVNPVTSTGRAAALDGPIAVNVISGSGSVDLLADGLSFFLVSGDTPGDTTYLVEGDADLGSGVVAVSDTITLHVAGALAAALGLTAAAPEPK